MNWRERLARALATRQRDVDQRAAAQSGSDVFLPLEGYVPWAEEMADAILACIDTAGCAILPEEPTEEMRAAGEAAWKNRNIADPDSEPIRDCYRAMYAARPK